MRRLMVLVAIVGAILGVRLGLKRRAAGFMERAVLHSLGSARARQQIVDLDPRPGSGVEAMLVEKAEYHSGMRVKYRYAAEHPWLPVEPDPPEPE